MEAEAARAAFADAIAGADEEVDVAHACLLISAEANPELEVDAYRARLDELAAAPALDCAGVDSLAERVEVLNAYFHEGARFRGNREHYYDPRNSYLDRVLDRRTGIPITLAIVWMAIAERAGVACHGIGFPGHFLVGVEAQPRLLVDAFVGESLDVDDCRDRLRKMYGGRVEFQDSLLRPAGRKEILARVLRNLKQIHMKAEDYETAVACSDRILLIEPTNATELRDRGLLYRALECWNAARDDLEQFLALAPDSLEREDVELVLDELRTRTAHLH